MTPSIGEDFVGWKPPTGGYETLGSSTFRSARTWITRAAGNTMADAQKRGPTG